MRLRLWFLLTCLLLALPAAAQDVAPVVGSLVDLSGPTAVFGEAYARGVRKFVEHFNSTGGIDGKPLRLAQIDCGDDPVRAIEAYRDLLSTPGLVAILGWGSRDTEPLASQVREDRIPFFLSVAPARYADPERHPYHFPTVLDYSTLLRAGLTHLREGWQEARPPKLAFLFPSSPFGREPVTAGKAHATQLGFQVVAEVETAPGKEEESLTGLLALAPDFVWLGGTAAETAALIKRSRELGLQARFLCNLWAAAGLTELAGPTAQGTLSVGPTALPGDGTGDLSGVTRAIGGQPLSAPFVRGWVAMQVTAKALSLADASDILTGEGVKSAAEGLSAVPIGGFSAPITYTASDHRPNLSARIHEWRGGTWAYVGTVKLNRDALSPAATQSQKASGEPEGDGTPAPAANSEGG